MKNELKMALVGLALVMGSVSSLRGEEWGNLKIKFVYDGQPPKMNELKVDKDVQVCAMPKKFEEKLVVSSSGGLRDVLMFISPEGDKKVPVHPSYNDSAQSEVRIDNDKCRFEPRVVVVRTSQTLVIGNKDSVGHNSKVDFSANPAINPIIPAASDQKVKFKKPEKRQSPISCSIHPWMSGWVLVRDEPYMAVSNAEGEIVMENVPVGKWQFQLWQEELGYVAKPVDASGKAQDWKKGKVTFEIKAGDNDLGVFKVKAK